VEIDWTTFVLEIINFLVLVWILKRFLYRPVLRVIEERRARIESELTEAKQAQDEAEKQRSQYENRLAEWQHDRQKAREELERELQQQRSRALEELEKSLGHEREKASVIDQRHEREVEEGRQRAALELGARFAARLLKDLSGPELEGRILELVSAQLGQLPEQQKTALRRAMVNGRAGIRVVSAHPLGDEQRAKLQQALKRLLGSAADCAFAEEPALIAGLRLSLGDWSLNANLADELKGFTEQGREID